MPLKLNPSSSPLTIPDASSTQPGLVTLDQIAQAQALSWIYANKQSRGAFLGALVPLLDGRAISCCGNDNNFAGNQQNVLSIYNNLTNQWKQGTSFPGTARFLVMCALMPDGSVLVGGGTQNPFGAPFTDLYRWTPSTDTWQQLDSFPLPRGGKGVPSVLSGGKVLFVGNYDTSPSPSLDPTGALECQTTNIFDITAAPGTQFTAGASMNRPRETYQMPRLADGRFLQPGTRSQTPIPWIKRFWNMMEAYAPVPDTWTDTPIMPQIQGEDYNITPAVLRADGSVQVPSDLDVPYAGARWGAGAQTMNNGNVLLAGGTYARCFNLGPAGAVASIKKPIPDIPNVMEITGLVGASTLPNNPAGTMIRLDGCASDIHNDYFAIYEVVNDTTIRVCVNFGDNRSTLPDANNGAISWALKGSLLSGRKSVLAFTPANTFIRLADMLVARGNLPCMTLSDGRIIVVGGMDSQFGPRVDTEIYAPINDTWVPGPTMPKQSFGKIDSRGVQLAKFSWVEVFMTQLANGDGLVANISFVNSTASHRDTFRLQTGVGAFAYVPKPQGVWGSPEHKQNNKDYNDESPSYNP